MIAESNLISSMQLCCITSDSVHSSPAECWKLHLKALQALGDSGGRLSGMLQRRCVIREVARSRIALLADVACFGADLCCQAEPLCLQSAVQAQAAGCMRC